MDQRPTQELTIGDHTFTVKTYATAREAHDIQAVYFAGAKVDVVGQEPRISEFNPNVQWDVQCKMVEVMVLEMDGTKENIVQRAEGMLPEEFEELTSTLDGLVTKKKK